ncbi:MAG: Ig-like domain-containing protein [Terracidiphilus sp.]
MSKYRTVFTCFLATLLVALVAGCGQETVTIPGVVSVTPAQGATDVVINTTVTATFSMAMNPSTITTSTFTLTGPGGAVTGAVTYSGTVATFTPAAVLAYGTTYTATITNGVATPGGAELIGNYVWTFSTVSPPPTVISTVPLAGATGVSVSQVLSATFSEPMDPTTISTTTFTLTGPEGAVVDGTVAYSGVVATFTPMGNLAYSTQYTATITTGATSGGVPLAANYVWTFTTITPPPVVVSTIPVNTATGVPLSQVISATFSEPMNCVGFPAAAFIVTGPGATAVPGTIGCSGAVATFTPDDNLAFNTVYTATITTGATSLGGTPLAANYVWTFRTLPAPTPPTVISTVPVNGATAVPINQALSATFSVAMTPATIDATTFTLAETTSGTAVTGVVTYVAAGSVATFTPKASLAPTTEYTATITTGAKNLAGTGLASNYVWTFTTAALPSAIPPTVVSTIPLDLATDVPLNQIVSATFSKAMDPATISSATFTLTAPGTPPVAVPGLVAYAAVGNTLTFTPTANLAPSTVYTATITTGAQDLTGTPLANNYVWTFTTGTAVSTTPPEIVSTVPANLATDVPLSQAVSATFTEAMNPLTITTATFQLTGPGGAAIVGTVSYDAVDFIATFTPTAPLTASTTYTATVTIGATDVAGNPLGTTGAPNPWTFTTGTAVVPPPVVLGPTIALFGGFGGGAGMTNQGIHTVVNGDIGTTGASTTMTGFHDTSLAKVGAVWPCTYTESPLNVGQVNGTIDTAPPPPTVECATEGTAATMAIATEAALEARTAYTALQGLPSDGALAAEIGNTTIYPGVYTNASSVKITLGPLTLDAQGDPNASWVFQIGSSLTVGTPTASESVILIGGAQAKNVFWAVGGLPGAIINYGGGGTMVGTIISQPGITVSSPGVTAITTINGRVIALTASTTIVNTVINVPAP